MNDEQLENLIRNQSKIDQKGNIPSREVLSRILYSLPESPVTISALNRYGLEKSMSNIIINLKEFLHIWRSKKIILVPSFVLIVFIGLFSLSSHVSKSNSVLGLAEKNEAIEEPGLDYDDQVILTTFDNSNIDELNVIQNEQYY